MDTEALSLCSQALSETLPQVSNTTGWIITRPAPCQPLPHPPNSYVEVLAPLTQNATIFGHKVFKEVIKLKLGLRVDPNSELLVSLWKGGVESEHRHIHRGMVKEKTWGEEGHLQAKDRLLGQILPSQPSEEAKPADPLISDFQPPELREINFCFWRHSVCGPLLWQL